MIFKMRNNSKTLIKQLSGLREELSQIQDDIDRSLLFQDQIHWLSSYNYQYKRVDFPCLYNEDRRDVLEFLPTLLTNLQAIEETRLHSSVKSASFQSVIHAFNQKLSERARSREIKLTNQKKNLKPQK